jgi:YD repeat-containing protein
MGSSISKKQVEEGVVMYRLPFYLVSGQGLGHRYSSLSQIGSLVPQAGVGQAQVDVYLNVNGNVVVEDPKCPVVEGGHELPLQMVYNSQVSSSQEAWRFTAEKRLRQAASDTLVITEACGHETVYCERKSWFVAEDASDGHLLLNEEDGTFELRLPSAGEALWFDASGHSSVATGASLSEASMAWVDARVNCEDKHVVLHRVDGTSVTFSRRGYWYMGPNHGSGTSRVYYDEGCSDMPWVWVDPASGAQERYNADGLRVQWRDSEGRGWRLAQEALADEMRWVLTGDSGLCYVLQPQAIVGGAAERCYVLSEEGEGCTPVVLRRYYFNADGLLTRTVFADGYTVTYGYKGYRPWLLHEIVQTDGTRLALGYRAGADGLPQVREVTLGQQPEGVRWFFNHHGDGRVEVTDNQWRCRLQLDDCGNVRALTQEVGFDDDDQWVEETIHYRYTTPVHGAGQIERITYPTGGEEHFEYDAFSGLVTCHTGTNGQVGRYYYVLDGTRPEMLVSQVEEVDGQSQLTQHVYDYDYNGEFTYLRFVLSPQGQVTEYLPQAKGQVVTERVYLASAYPRVSLPGYPPLLHELTQWVRAQQEVGGLVSVREQRFDARYQVLDTLEYAQVDAPTGKGVMSEGMQVVRTPRDRAGQVTDRWQLLAYRGGDEATDADGLEVKDETQARLAVDGFVWVSPADEVSDELYMQDEARGTTLEANFVEVARLPLDDLDVKEAESTRPFVRTVTSVLPELPAPGSYAHEQWVFDALQRERSHCDALGAHTQHGYEDAKRTLSVHYPNAWVAGHEWDSKGVEVRRRDTAYSDEKPQTRERCHRFGRVTGELMQTTQPDGRQTYTFYDLMGRAVLTIEASAWNHGLVLRTIMDTAHRCTQTIAYAQPLNLSKYKERFEQGDFPPTEVMLAEIEQQDLTLDPNNQVRYRLLDTSDRLRYEVVDGGDPLRQREPVWSVTEHVYDALSRPIRTILYAHPLTEAEHRALLAGEALSRTATPQVDRVSQTFYTAEGLVLAEQDEAGYVTRYVYDAGGRVCRTTHYATPTEHTQDLTLLFPKPHPEDAHDYVYYDALSRPVLAVDAGGFVTTRRYQAEQLHERRRFAKPVSAAWWALSEPRPQPDMPTPSEADECITYGYDEKGRLVEERHLDGTLQVNTYDAMDQLTEQVVQDVQAPTLSDGDHRRAQGWRFDGWGQVTHYANAYVCQAQQAVLTDETLSPSEKEAKLAELWQTRAERRFYTPCGLHIRVMQRVEVAPGQWHERKTLTYYDRRRRPAVTIDAGGAVVRYDYHPLHEAPANVYRYARVLPPEALTPLLGGYLRDLPNGLLEGLSDPARDRQEAFDFDRRGLPVRRVDGEGHAWRTQFNAFGEDVAQEEPAVHAGQPIHITREREVRGLVTGSTRAAGDLRLTTHSRRAHRMGLVTESVDALGASTFNTHDCLGRLHTVREAGQSRASARAHDAWGRVIRFEDVLGQVTGHTYDRQQRTHTISHPQAGTWTRTDKNIFDEAVHTHTPLDETRAQTSRREHAPDGQVRLEEDGQRHQVQRVFNDLGWLLSEVDGAGMQTQWHYDDSGFVVARIDDVHGRALRTDYRRDAFGQVTQEIRPDGVVIEHRYNRQGHEVRRVLDPTAARAAKGEVSSPTAFEIKTEEAVPAAGWAQGDATPAVMRAKVESPRAAVTAMPVALEVKATPASGADEPLGLLKQTQVNAYGAPVGLSQGDETTPMQYREAYAQDALNRQVATIVDPKTPAQASALALTTRRTLDAKGRVVARFDAKGQVCYDVFDARDNRVFAIDASGAVVARGYDDLNQCHYQRAYRQRLAIDALPCPPTIADVRAALAPLPQDPQTYYYYDGNQRLCVTLTVGHVLPDLPTDKLSDGVRTAQITEYGYDRAGHRTSKRQYAHLWLSVPETVGDESLAQIEETIHPWRDEEDDRCQYWSYDLAGRESFHVDSDGSVHRSDYDGKGRVITRWHYAHQMTEMAGLTYETPEALRERLPVSSEDEVTQFFYTLNEPLSPDGAARPRSSEDAAVFNKPTCVISPNGLVHEFVYTPMGDLTENRQYAQALNPRRSRAKLRQALSRLRSGKQEGIRVTRTLWDKGRRKQQVIDAAGFTETFAYTALDTLYEHIDRRGGITTFVLDDAKRVEQEYQPAARSFTTQQNAEHRLELKALGLASLHIHKTLDPNGNAIQIHYDDGHTLTKTIEHVFDARDWACVHRVRDVPVDDPSRPVEFAHLPVQTVVQETGSRTDGLGRTFCEQQANGHWEFSLYDGLGRKMFAIATDGAVIGYRHNAFGDVVEKVKYAQRVVMSEEELATFKETGVPDAWLQAHLVLDPQHDRRWFYQRDAKGRVIVERKPTTPVYEPRTRRLFAQEQPVMFQTFNGFDHCVERRAPLYPQVSGGPESLTRTWYNHGGKPLCEIEAVQLAVEAPVTYRAKRFWYNAFDERIGRREYQGVLAQLPDGRLSIGEIDALLASLPDPEGKTRTRHYPRDARGLLMQRVSEQVVRQRVSHSDSPEAPLQAPQMHDLPAQDLAETYTYTSTARRCQRVSADGSDSYRYFDGKDRVIADIGATVEVLDEKGAAQERRPATLYYYDGFDQRVGERTLALGAPVDVTEHELPPLTLSEADEITLFLPDVRGRMSLTQLPNGTLTGYTYPLSGRQSIREWVVSKGYAHDEKGAHREMYHVDEAVSRLDKSDRVVSAIRRRDHQVVRAEHRAIDGLGDVVAQVHNASEPPPDSPSTWPIQHRYVGDHVNWLSVDSDGIPTIRLSDARGMATAKVTSAERDLSQVALAALPEVLQDARVELEAKVSAPQGVVLESNHTYIDPLPPGKERIEVDFDVSRVDGHGSVQLRWIKQPMPGLTPRCFVWREGEAREEYAVLEDKDGREGVELAHAVTDRYFVELEYLRVEGGQVVTGVAQYYASGEVSVVGVRETDAKQLVVSNLAPATIKLCGRTEDLRSVILYRDEAPLAEYKVHEDKTLDLSAQASGVYCFKPRYGTQGALDDALTLPFTLYTPTASPQPLSRQFHPQPGLQVVHIEGIGIPLTEGKHKEQIGYTFGHFTLWESLPADYHRYPATVTIHYWPKEAGTGPELKLASIEVTPGEYLSDFPDDIPGMPQANMVLPEHMGVLVSLSVSLRRGSAVGERNPLLLYEDEAPVGSALWPVLGDAKGQSAADACEDKGEAPLAAVDASWMMVPEVITYRFAAKHRVVIEPLVLGADESLHFFDKSQGRQAGWVRLANTLSQAGTVVSFDLSGQRPGVYPFSLGEDMVRLSRARGQTFTLLGEDSAGVFVSAPAQPVAPQPMEASRRLGWDVWDQLAWQESALGARTDYARNDEDALIQITGPELTLYRQGQPYQGRVVERLGYNLLGDEIGQTNGRGHTQVLLYDASSHKTGRILGDGTWSYRQWHDLLAQRVVYEDSAGHRWRTRYERGYPVETVSPENRVTRREFTVRDRLIRHEAPGGLVHYYAHDVDGMVSELTFSGDGSWVRTHYDAQQLPVLRAHSDGKSMHWQYDDYGHVLERVDFGLNRLRYWRDFKQQVVEETGQLFYSGDNPTFTTYDFVRVWLSLLGYHYVFFSRTISGRRHLTYTYSGGHPIGVYDWERNIASTSGYNADGLRTALQVYQGDQLLRTIRSQLDGLDRMVRSIDDYSVYETGFDEAGNRVLNRAQVGTLKEERHSLFDKAERALIDQGVLENGEVVLAPGRGVAARFLRGVRVTESRRVGLDLIVQFIQRDKEGRVTGTTSVSLTTERGYLPNGLLSRLIESGKDYRLAQLFVYMALGAVKEQQTRRDGKLINTTILHGHEQGHPRYQYTRLHTDDNLRYELHLDYTYSGEQAHLIRSSGKVFNNDGDRDTTVAQSWRDGNHQLRAQTGTAVMNGRRWSFYWVGWPVFSVRSGLVRASSWLARAGGQEKVLLCQLVLADREACWYACYWMHDGRFGFSELTAQDAGYAVLRTVGEVPSQVEAWHGSALTGVLPRLRGQGVDVLTDMHGLSFSVSGLSSGESLSQLAFARWWESWLTQYVSVRSGIFKTQFMAYEQEAGGALLNKYRMVFPVSPAWSVARQMLFMGVERELLCSVVLMFLPVGQLASNVSQVSLLPRQRETSEGAGAELVARMGSEHSAGASGLPGFGFFIQMGLQARSVIKHPRPVSAEDLTKAGERGMLRLGSDLSAGSTTHTVGSGETLKTIARQYYQDEEYAELLRLMTVGYPVDQVLPEGLMVQIPALTSYDAKRHFPGYQEVLSLHEHPLVPYMQAPQKPPPPPEKKRKCKHKVTQAVVTVMAATAGTLLLAPILGPSAPVASQVFVGFLLGASLSGGLQKAARQLNLLDHFSWKDMLLTGVGTGVAAGVGSYLESSGVARGSRLLKSGVLKRLTVRETLTHLALAHGTSNVASQLTLLSLGQQERLSGRAFLAGVAAGIASHGLSRAFGNSQEVDLWEMIIQQQVTDVLGTMIREEQFDLELLGMSLLGVGVSFGTRKMMQALGDHYGRVSASDTEVQEAHKHQEEGAHYVSSVEDPVYKEGELAGQGYASGHEHAGESEPRRPNIYFQEDSASDERRYTPRWLEERGMSLMPESRHGVQALDRFALEDLMTFDIPSVSPSSGLSEYGKAIGSGLWRGVKQDAEAMAGLLYAAGRSGTPEGTISLVMGAAALSQKARHWLTDGLYAATDKLFNVSTDASRARRAEFTRTWQSMSGPERAGKVSEFAGGFLAGGALGKAATTGARAFSRAGQMNTFGVFGGRGAGGVAVDSRTIAPAHVREARNILKRAGLDAYERNQIFRSFDLETFRVERVSGPRQVFRVFDDSEAKLMGRYAATNFSNNQTERIVKFALPNNSATRLSIVDIPKGATIFTGRVAPQVSVNPGLIGGEQQIFLTGRLGQYKFTETLMPREKLVVRSPSYGY